MFSDLKSDDILDILCIGKGYQVLDILGTSEQDKLWELVLASFASCFPVFSPERKDMINVHKNLDFSSRFSSLSVWDRTLNFYSALKLIQLDWIIELSNLLGFYPIDSYGFGYPSFTWRLMRPGHSVDLRGVHRDSWFRISNGNPSIIDTESVAAIQTIKVWVALNVVPNMSGLLVSPFSQLASKPSYKVVNADNMTKPSVIASEVDTRSFIYAPTSNGSIVLFGEQLMHGGGPTSSNSSRVSLEFTLARPAQDQFETFIYSNNINTKKIFTS